MLRRYDSDDDDDLTPGWQEKPTEDGNVNFIKLQVLNLVKGRNTLLMTLLGPGSVTAGAVFTTEMFKLDYFEMQFEILSTNNSTNQALVRSKFINTKLVHDYIVWITISRKNKVKILSSSNEWSEIYRTNGKDHFEIEVEVVCVPIKKEISNTFKTLLDDEELVDFKIVVGGSKKEVKQCVGFHRAVLSAWSPVFMKMFSGAWKEKLEGEVELPLHISVIKAFKKFVYMDELPIDREILLGLIELGSYYMIPKLEDDAIEAVADTTNTENFYETLEFSFAKQLEKLTAAMLLKSRSVDVERIAKVIMVPKDLED